MSLFDNPTPLIGWLDLREARIYLEYQTEKLSKIHSRLEKEKDPREIAFMQGQISEIREVLELQSDLKTYLRDKTAGKRS